VAQKPSEDRWDFNPKPIEECRKALGLSPSAFGGALVPPMSGAQIIDIERKRRGLTMKSLIRLCNHFGLPPGKLFKARSA